MISIEFPKLAIDYVEMFIREEIGYFIYVVFLLEFHESCKEIAVLYVTAGQSALPGTVKSVEYSTNHLKTNRAAIKVHGLMILYKLKNYSWTYTNML